MSRAIVDNYPGGGCRPSRRPCARGRSRSIAPSPTVTCSPTNCWSRFADDLRHTFASLALQESVPVKVVSEMLRHASVTITYDICSRDHGHVT